MAVACVGAALPVLLGPRDRRVSRGVLTPALVILTGGAAVTFAAWLAFGFRCDKIGCRPGEGTGLLDHWWRSDHAWMWSAQLLVASAGLAAAAASFVLIARGRRAGRVPLWLARALYAVWVAAVFFTPLAHLVLGRD